jgi:hypothetical protein
MKDQAKREEEEKRFWRETLREIRAPTPLFKASPTAERGAPPPTHFLPE